MTKVVDKIVEAARAGRHNYETATSGELQRQLKYFAKDENFRKMIEFFVDLGHTELSSIIKHVGGLVQQADEAWYGGNIRAGLGGLAFEQLVGWGILKISDDVTEMSQVFFDWAADLYQERKAVIVKEQPPA